MGHFRGVRDIGKFYLLPTGGMSGASALLDAGERDLLREVTSTSARLSAAECRGNRAVRAPCVRMFLLIVP